MRLGPLWIPVGKLSTSNKLHSEDSKQNEVEEKPNLRKGPSSSNAKVAVGACILALIVMYPMIFRPMFGISSLGEDDSTRVRAQLDEKRPGSMPEWTSPFGPKKSDR